MYRVTVARAALVVSVMAAHARAQTNPVAVDGATTPRALADTVLARFARKDLASFERVFPFAAGRGQLASAVQRGYVTVPSGGRVIRVGGDTAVVLLATHIAFGNSGDETSAARHISGLYIVRRSSDGLWRIDRQLPLGDQVRITGHRIVVDLTPGTGLSVVDTMAVVVTGRSGFAVRLNHAAALGSVTVNARGVPYHFGGGMLWVDVPPSTSTTVALRYTIDVRRDSSASANSGRFTPRFGHVRNQYWWHPFVWFDDAATVRLTVRAPAHVLVATDLPQTDTVIGNRRRVDARSALPAAALSLFYDADWRPIHRHVGQQRFSAFATPDFVPAPDSLAGAFEYVGKLLTERFGPPHGGYVAVVQQRARDGGGWLFMSNSVIAAGKNGGAPIQAGENPRAYFGHEVAHGWTHPTGAAINFLSEGWATYCEALLLRDSYGPTVEAAFWERQRAAYLGGNFEGRVALTNDVLNRDVAYSKGAWVLRMLEHAIGRAAFDSGVRAYMRIPPGAAAGVEQFIERVSAAAGRDLRAYLRPWVDGTSIPAVIARIENDSVVVRQTQEGPLFQLDLDIAVALGADTSRIAAPLRGREVRVPVPPTHRASGAVVMVDPDRLLLLKPTP